MLMLMKCKCKCGSQTPWVLQHFLKKTTKEQLSIISNEWLEESKLSSDVIHLDHLLFLFIARLTKLLSMLFIILLWVLISCLQPLLMIY
jgi:hypothetical protein